MTCCQSRSAIVLNAAGSGLCLSPTIGTDGAKHFSAPIGVRATGTDEPGVSFTTRALTASCAALQHVEAGQRVAQRAEIGAGHQHQRNVQRHHPVEHGVAVVERHHDAADTFDQQLTWSVFRWRAARTRPGRRTHERASRAGGDIGRKRRGEAPGRDAFDLLRRDRPGRAPRAIPAVVASASAGSKPVERA